MKLASLNPGDTVEANVKGRTFNARIVSKENKGLVRVEPEVSWATWRFLSARQIVKRVDRQEQTKGTMPA